MNQRASILLALSAAIVAAPLTAAPVAGPDRRMDKRIEKQRDHDAAREAVLRREVLPLPRILTLVGGYQAGDVIEIELKSRRGPLFYDVDVLVPSGVVRKLKIDARTGKLIANTAKGE